MAKQHPLHKQLGILWTPIHLSYTVIYSFCVDCYQYKTTVLHGAFFKVECALVNHWSCCGFRLLLEAWEVHNGPPLNTIINVLFRSDRDGYAHIIPLSKYKLERNVENATAAPRTPSHSKNKNKINKNGERTFGVRLMEQLKSRLHISEEWMHAVEWKEDLKGSQRAKELGGKDWLWHPHLAPL